MFYQREFVLPQRTPELDDLRIRLRAIARDLRRALDEGPMPMPGFGEAKAALERLEHR